MEDIIVTEVETSAADLAEFVDRCGGDLEGYIRRYGWQRGPALYSADTIELGDRIAREAPERRAA